RQLIRESGVDTSKVTLRLLNGERGGAWERLAEYTRQALQPLGLRVQVVTSDSATWYQRASNWDFDLTYNFNFQVGDPYLSTAYFYRSEYILKTSPFANIVGYRNPEADALWRQVADAGNETERRQLYSELEHLLNHDLPLIPIFEISFTTLYRDKDRKLLQTATTLNESYDSVYLEGGQ